MAAYPEDLHYTKDHEWLRVEGDIGTVGITAFAQEQLSDVLSVQLPRLSEEFKSHETFGEIESVKDASEIYTPVSGQVVAVNEALDDRPELINNDPYGDGWMIKLMLNNTGEVDRLLSSSEYEDFVKSKNEE